MATALDRPNLVFNVSVCRPMIGGFCDGAMVCLYSSDSQLSLPKGWKDRTPIAKFASNNYHDATPHYEGSDIVVSYPILADICQPQAYAKIRFICPSGNEV